jgi:hypothetical protein
VCNFADAGASPKPLAIKVIKTIQNQARVKTSRREDSSVAWLVEQSRWAAELF